MHISALMGQRVTPAVTGTVTGAQKATEDCSSLRLCGQLGRPTTLPCLFGRLEAAATLIYSSSPISLIGRGAAGREEWPQRPLWLLLGTCTAVAL